VAAVDRGTMFAQSRGVAVTVRQTAGPHWQPSSMNELFPLVDDHGAATNNNNTTRTPFLLQNVPSAVVAHALVGDLLVSSSSSLDAQQHPTKSTNNSNNKPLMILDMCAAPGGKASHVASLLRTAAAATAATASPAPATIIVACDKSRSKVVAMRTLFQRLGVMTTTTTTTTSRSNNNNNGNNINIIPLVLNTTQCVLQSSSSTQQSVAELLAAATPSSKDQLLQGIAGFPPESFDRILLDPPCSALGLRPKLAFPHDGSDWNNNNNALVRYQRQFVDAAVALLRSSGGILTYSTCTILMAENEHMVRYILETYRDCMELVPVFDFETDNGDTKNSAKLSSLGGPGLLASGLTAEQCACVRRFDPADRDSDTMGFFLAKFRKTARTTTTKTI